MPLPAAPVAVPQPQPALKPPVKKARKRRWALPALAAAWLLVPSEPPAPPAAEEPAQKEMTAADAYEKIRPSVVMVRGSPYDCT